jgi:hypothetical protein
LLARAKRYQWRDCEELVITKSWLAPLGGKNKASVNPERVVQILYDNGAPGEALQGNNMLEFDKLLFLIDLTS